VFLVGHRAGKQAGHGFTGEEFATVSGVIATANPPDGQQTGNLGRRQIFRQHVQTFPHGFLFSFDNDVQGGS
jgi:hypothetical protein